MIMRNADVRGSLVPTVVNTTASVDPEITAAIEVFIIIILITTCSMGKNNNNNKGQCQMKATNKGQNQKMSYRGIS